MIGGLIFCCCWIAGAAALLSRPGARADGDSSTPKVSVSLCVGVCVCVVCVCVLTTTLRLFSLSLCDPGPALTRLVRIGSVRGQIFAVGFGQEAGTDALQQYFDCSGMRVVHARDAERRLIIGQCIRDNILFHRPVLYNCDDYDAYVQLSVSQPPVGRLRCAPPAATLRKPPPNTRRLGPSRPRAVHVLLAANIRAQRIAPRLSECDLCATNALAK